MTVAVTTTSLDGAALRGRRHAHDPPARAAGPRSIAVALVGSQPVPKPQPFGTPRTGAGRGRRRVLPNRCRSQPIPTRGRGARRCSPGSRRPTRGGQGGGDGKPAAGHLPGRVRDARHGGRARGPAAGHARGARSHGRAVSRQAGLRAAAAADDGRSRAASSRRWSARATTAAARSWNLAGGPGAEAILDGGRAARSGP